MAAADYFAVVQDVPELTDHLFRREAGKMVSYFSEAFETLNRATAAGNAHGSGKACGNLKGVPDSKYRWPSSRPDRR